jgi:FkbM family methyltransferase
MQTKIRRIAHSARHHLALFGVKGLLRRAALALPGTGNEFKATIPGSSRDVLIRLGTTDVAAFEHVFVGNEYGFSLSQPPSIIVDAGANVGMSAVYFAQRYPSATIIAVELDPDNFAILKKNADLFPAIKPVHAALWNHDGLVGRQDGGAGGWGMRVTDAAETHDGIRSMTLPTLMKEHDIQHIDLLKIDVEGAECEILEHASTWIGNVSVVCAELHDRFKPGCTEAFEGATADFPVRWRRGELHCVARHGSVPAN